MDLNLKVHIFFSYIMQCEYNNSDKV